MQNHGIAFTRAFITSAFTVPDDEDLVCMSLVGPPPDAVAVLCNRCLAHREFTPAMHIYVYRKGTFFVNIELCEICWWFVHFNCFETAEEIIVCYFSDAFSHFA